MSSKLNVKQWMIATIVTFIALSILEYLVHFVLMSSLYSDFEYLNYWRPRQDVMNLMVWMYLGYFLFAGIFSFIYTRGYEGKPGLGEGLRYGFLVGLLIGVPGMFVQHALFPYPGTMLMSWAAATLVECVLLGLLVGMIYKSEKKAA